MGKGSVNKRCIPRLVCAKLRKIVAMGPCKSRYFRVNLELPPWQEMFSRIAMYCVAGLPKVHSHGRNRMKSPNR